MLINELHQYCRKFQRQNVKLEANVEIVTIDGRTFNKGTAMVQDISLKGALLTNIKLKRPYLPTEVFTIHVRFKDPKYSGIDVVCKPVRFHGSEDFELGVEFTDLGVKA